MSGMEQPDAVGLLEIARAALQADVLPHVQGDARFKALMIANALAIAQRALAGEPLAAWPDAAATCAGIRAGAHDGDSLLHARLLAFAEARCRISAPKAL